MSMAPGLSLAGAPATTARSSAALRIPLFGVERKFFTLHLMGDSQRETSPEPHCDRRVCYQPFGPAIDRRRHGIRRWAPICWPFPQVSDDDDLHVPTSLARFPLPAHGHMGGP